MIERLDASMMAISRLFVAACLVFPAAVRGGQQPASNSGQELFTRYCALCHGANGEGASGPDLTNPRWQSATSDEDVERTIRGGIRGTSMPSFGDRLTRVDVQLLVRHLRSLASEAIQPANRMQAPRIQVSSIRLLGAGADSDNWLMYGRDYGNRRFSPLRAIRRENVRNLVPVWSFQTGVQDGLESTPLFVDGVIYLTTAWNHVFAIDARTASELWHYRRRLPAKLTYCCGPVNRGAAISGGTLYLATLDAHLVAMDAQTGRVRWDVQIGAVEDNLSATSPPLIVDDKVVVGMAGGDYESRGFIDAYQTETGRRLWRFYTVADHGGGATWLNGSYDPELKLIYWGTGNPNPDYDGDARPGDNLYTDCVVALESETGKLRWHYQFTPHDVWDYDGVNEMVLVDLPIGGHMERALLHADRNGHFYALDRTNGRFLYAQPFVRVTWTKGFENGRPVINPQAIPTVGGVTVCPGAAGGKEWNPMSFSPLTGLVYLPVIENCAVFQNYGVRAKRRGLAPGPSGFSYLPNQAYGKLMAVRADTGEAAWEVRTRTPMAGGTLVTAGGLVFSGDAEGNFTAHDAATGEQLWSYQTGSGIRGAPVSYRLDGKEYIAVASGMSGAVGGFTGAGAPWMRDYRSGGTLFIFALFEPGASEAFAAGAR
ncbi:MAG TPA: PQQ-binding-like beta-propeller repeat protein [Bryobacteraceae bacterium]|nr:PQQ-binding-like beta-propeller repeat protein [Bryobacteraceae bacterium]